MKTFTKILNATITLCIALSFTSCLDDDEIKSAIITGEWRGNFGMYYDYHCNICHETHRYYASDTHIVFHPSHSYSTHGYGYQSDYYSHGPYSYQYYYFHWEIDDGVLYLNYPYAEELNTEIFDYHINEDVFTGRIGDNGGSFYLYKVADISDWSNCYDSDYYYEERYSWHSTANKACLADSIEGIVVRRGNILNTTEK